mgnify:CR=1 FL=1
MDAYLVAVASVVMIYALLAIGLYGALVTAPADYQQGETVRKIGRAHV